MLEERYVATKCQDKLHNQVLFASSGSRLPAGFSRFAPPEQYVRTPTIVRGDHLTFEGGGARVISYRHDFF